MLDVCTYAEKICKLIEDWDLTQYDIASSTASEENKTEHNKAGMFVRISIADLNIREKPDIHSRSHGFTGKGVFTIVEERDGWGLLKSYSEKKNGWIKLSFTTKIQ